MMGLKPCSLVHPQLCLNSLRKKTVVMVNLILSHIHNNVAGNGLQTDKQKKSIALSKGGHSEAFSET
jgi:hypothetical protein